MRSALLRRAWCFLTTQGRSLPGWSLTISLHSMTEGLARAEHRGARLEVGVARVLVVDDDELIRRALVRLLVGLGHDVEDTGSPVDALARVSDAVPDLLVTDYAMPEMTGLSLVARLRAVLGARCPPVLFVSGSEVEAVVRMATPGLRLAFVAKPFDTTVVADEARALMAATM